MVSTYMSNEFFVGKSLTPATYNESFKCVCPKCSADYGSLFDASEVVSAFLFCWGRYPLAVVRCQHGNQSQLSRQSSA